MSRRADATDDVLTDGVADLVDPRSLDDVVSIHCYGRSGSVFLASLFDQHPQVLMIPGVQFSSFYEFWRRHGHLPAIELLGTFLAVFRAIYRVHQPDNTPIFAEKPLDGPPSRVDDALFSDTLLRLIADKVHDVQTEPVARKYFFQAVHAAYAVAMRRKVCWEDAVIIYSLHEPLEEHTTPFGEDFPNARYLHTVRTPVRAVDSWYRMGLPARVHKERLAAVGMLNMLTQARPVSDSCAPRSRAVRLEDLHTNPRATLEKLCDWLGLAGDGCLFESTFNGVRHSEGVEGTVLEGFQTQAISRNGYYCCRWIDVVRLNLIFARIFSAWGYPLSRVYRARLLQRLVPALMLAPFRIEQLVWKRDLEIYSLKTLRFDFDRYVELRKYVLTYWREDGRREPRLLELL